MIDDVAASLAPVPAFWDAKGATPGALTSRLRRLIPSVCSTHRSLDLTFRAGVATAFAAPDVQALIADRHTIRHDIRHDMDDWSRRMASIYRDCVVGTSAADAWAVLREPLGCMRAFAGVLVAATLDGDVRTVTFANGGVVQERIVTIDDVRMRLAYGVVGGRFEHHHASIQIVPLDDTRCRFVWISDFAPNALLAFVEPLIDAGCPALARNLSRDPAQ